MANANGPFGFRPLMRTLGGGEPEIQMRQKAATLAHPIYNQDLVIPVSDGTIDGYNLVPGTSRYAGVALNYGAASALTNHILMVSRDALYVVQSDSDGLARSDIFATVNVAYGAGDANTKISGDVANAAANTTSSSDLRILDFWESIDNAEGAYAKVIVLINKHVFNPEVTGV